MHLVLGATGGFGGAMVRALLARGLPVRALVRDPSRARLPPGVEVVAGDARSMAELVPAAKGCESITHALNVPFAAWEPEMIGLTENVIEASGYSGAAIVFPGNLMGLKPIYAVPLPPDAPKRDGMDRPSTLGRVRNLLEDHLAQNAELRNIRTLVVRTGDLYGSGVDNAVVGPMFRAAALGRPVPWYGAASSGHAFTYVEDAASAAVGLLCTPDRPIFDVVALAGDIYLDAAEWAAALARASGHAALGVRAVPHWVIRLQALYNRDARDLAEVLYQWEAPMLLDDARLRRALPAWSPTPAAESLAATVAWFRERAA